MASIEATTEEIFFDELPDNEINEVRGILQERGYGEREWEKVTDFYRGKEFPCGNPKAQADKIEVRLPKIYPEKYRHDKFNNDKVNEIYSIIQQNNRVGEIKCMPVSHHNEIDLCEFEEIDAVFLDHNVIYDMLDKVEKRRVDPKDDEKEFKMPWYKPLEMVDNIIEWQEEDEIDLDLRYPGDLRDKACLYASKEDMEYIELQRELEVINCFKRIGKPMEIPRRHVEELREDFRDMAEDMTILDRLDYFYQNPLIVTHDSGFGKATEGYSNSIALLPDLGNFFLRYHRTFLKNNGSQSR